MVAYCNAAPVRARLPLRSLVTLAALSTLSSAACSSAPVGSTDESRTSSTAARLTISSGHYGIRAIGSTGNFVRANLNNNALLESVWGQIGAWENFTIQDNGDGTLSLQNNANGKWVSADLNLTGVSLIANRDTAQSWEKFQLVDRGDGTYSIIANANGKYVTTDENANNGVFANRDQALAWEQFQLVPTDIGNNRSLTSVAGGRCMDVEGASTVDGAQVFSWSCNAGSTNQSFSFVLQSNGFYEIVATNSGKCLDVPGGNAQTQNGTNLQQYGCWGGDNQLFSLDSVAGKVRIRNKATNKCIDTWADSDGAPVRVWDCNTTSPQQWLLGNGASQGPIPNTIDWSASDQRMTGFGISTAWIGGGVPQSVYDLLFSQQSGLGLSMLRTRIDPNGSWDGEAYAMQQAWQRGVRQIWSTEWSPPASYKSNNDVNNGGTLLASHYQDYAQYLANYVHYIQNTYGISLIGISPQNEPDYQTAYESGDVSGQVFHDFVTTALGPKFRNDGLSTKIILPETANWGNLPTRADPCLNDPNCSQYVGVAATHDYGVGLSSYPTAARQGKEFWETETSTFEAWDPSIGNGMKWAKTIHDSLVTGGVNAWHYWWARAGDNEGLVHDPDNQVSKRAWVIGNWSRFVRPGYIRIEAPANPAPNVWVTAFKDPGSNTLVVVAFNDGGSDTNLNLTVSRASASSLTPYVTSAGDSLTPYPPVSVNNGTFNWYLAAQSVVTFVGRVTPQ